MSTAQIQKTKRVRTKFNITRGQITEGIKQLNPSQACSQVSVEKLINDSDFLRKVYELASTEIVRVQKRKG